MSAFAGDAALAWDDDGKISAFYETWTQEDAGARLMASPVDLIAATVT